MAYFKWEIERSVATVVIENPPMNQLSSSVVREMYDVFKGLDEDKNVKAIVLTGAGEKAFIAGADIKELVTIKSTEQARESLSHFHRALSYMENMRKPIIAAINGYCLGGGLETALACHVRVAAQKAQLGVPEIKLGVFPGAGGTQRLPRVVGKAKALEMILTGEFISADEALRLNLVNRVVPDGEVLKAAKELAYSVASKGRISVEKAMDSVIAGYEEPIEKGLAIELDNFCHTIITYDAKEGLKAFLEKRAPKFEDR